MASGVRHTFVIPAAVSFVWALATAGASAATMHLPAGTAVTLRPVAPPRAGEVSVLQVAADVTIGGHLIFARGALARATVIAGTTHSAYALSRGARVRALESARTRLAVTWIMDTSGDRVPTDGTVPVEPSPLTAHVHSEDVTVPESYDPSRR